MFTEFIGRLLGVENLQSINGRTSRWPLAGPKPPARGCCSAVRRWRFWPSFFTPAGSRRAARSSACCWLSAAPCCWLSLFLILAEPVLKLDFTSQPRPLLWVLFDGTESMDIQDEMPDADRARLNEAVGLTTSESGATSVTAPASDANAKVAAGKSDSGKSVPADLCLSDCPAVRGRNMCKR